MIKTQRNRKQKIPHIVLERQTLRFSPYKNRKLKVKLWWIGPREGEKREFFITFILFEGHFFNICVLSQCIVYWIHIQNIHIKKYYFIHFCCWFLKSSKAFSVSLRILSVNVSKSTVSWKLRIWSYLLKKSLNQNFIFCIVLSIKVLFFIKFLSTKKNWFQKANVFEHYLINVF